MAVTGADVVAEARLWLGTPFYHAGRERGVAVDCVGLLICVGNELGLLGGYDNRSYSRVAPNGLTRAEVEKFCDPIGAPPEDAPAGSVLLFTVAGVEQHAGFADGAGGLVHAFESAGTVAEHAMTPAWVRMCSGVFWMRGVEGADKWQP